MEDKKLQKIVLLDVLKQISITNYFVIGTATNRKQAEALCDELKKNHKNIGLKLYGSEGGDGDFQWLLLDYSDIVVHIFQDPWREFYDLEVLWGDAPRIEWQKEGVSSEEEEVPAEEEVSSVEEEVPSEEKEESA